MQKISAQNYLNYYETINKAELANLDGYFKESDSLYQIAFGMVKKPFKEDYLFASINSERLKNSRKTYDYLRRGVLNGLTLKRIKSQLTVFKKTKEWKKLRKEYNWLHKSYMNTLNSSLYEEVAEMIRKDQASRHPIFGSSKRLKKVDNYNFKRLLEIIKENGGEWPGFSTIGENLPKGKYDVTGNIALLLLHFSREEIDLLKPYIFKAVMDGEMYPYHLARVIDYKNIFDCQPYGTYLSDGLSPICDCEKANLERKKIGFESIENYYRKRNSKYVCKK